MSLKVFICLIFALTAFAANSLLARLALQAELIDAFSFTCIRIASGAALLLFITRKTTFWAQGSWAGGGYLLVYAVCFAIAYLSLPTGLGALILFASVQLTMIIAALIRRDRISLLQGLGLVSSIAGFIYLFSPALERPPLLGSILMALSGIAWGLYSLKGLGTSAPIQATRSNFLRASILLLPVSLVAFFVSYRLAPQILSLSLTAEGVIYALLSGMITSGLGYVLWYIALQTISRVTAAISQLSVPVIAAILGLLFLSEPISLHFIKASVIILGGIGIYAVTGKNLKNS